MDKDKPGPAWGPGASENDVGQEGLTRRELLKRAGLFVGVAVVVPAVPVTAAQEPLRSLTRLEYETLDAICARIIPTDANGPGAREARAARFVDWGLAGALDEMRCAVVAPVAGGDGREVVGPGRGPRGDGIARPYGDSR